VPSFSTFTVAQLLAERDGLQRVGLDDGSRAYVLTELVGAVAVGDRVVVNTTAVDLGLGTGGWHVVHWNLSRETWQAPGSGHIMKLRYTSLQADTGSAEEHHPERLGGVPDLGGLPVVVCGLHSQVGCVAAAFTAVAPGRRLVYVMTDGAALPLALSDLVAALRERGLLAATVTAGQAFGGDLEAVTVPSALAIAARIAAADVVVVAMGPGVVGTGTALGATALEVAPLVDTAAALGAAPVVALRCSSADPRPRHRGISHHTRTALQLAARSATLAVPRGPFEAQLHSEIATHGLDQRHGVAVVDVPDMAAVLREMDLTVTTMGRGPEDDPVFFAAAGAAGVLAAALARGRGGTVQE
jgi:hypothetical protein